MNLNAVIFVPARDVAYWTKQCLDYCAAMGYRVAGVVLDKDGGWSAAMDLLRRDIAQVVVVARPEHLPRNRIPRIEVAAEAAARSDPEQAVPLRQRRPRRRDGAAR